MRPAASLSTMRMQLMFLGFLMLLACGGDETGPDDEPSDASSEPDADEVSDAGEASDAGSDAGEPDGPPHIALSGALSETLENTPPALTLSKASKQSSLIHLPASGDLSVSFSFTFAGAPEPGETYDDARSGVACALSVTRISDNATWDAAHGIMGLTEQGSCSFEPSTVMEMRDTETLTQFAVHGEVNGTLPAKEGSGAAGSITLQATF